jgi:cysteinyl-tRNA synthetase
MVALIQKLVEKGHAYDSKGSFYFKLDSFPAYGRLAGLDREGLIANFRVDSDEYEKSDVRDFVLWKATKEGEPFWGTPLGRGRPGWHIECSAMSMKYLGESFDIHTGGADNVFPHHENEIAQSEAATGKPFVHTWMHCAHLVVNGEKMSKSLGNFFTIREIFEKSKWPEAETGEMLRYFLLGTHYRSPLDFSDQAIEEAKLALDGFYDLFNRLAEPEVRMSGDQELLSVIERAREAFCQAMDDDLNTSVALAAFQKLRGDVNKLVEQGLSTEAREVARQSFRLIGNILGVFQLEDWKFKQGLGLKAESVSYQISGGDVDLKVAERNEARKQKDFKKADEIRQFLASHGIVIEDKPDGTSRWKR